MSRLDFKVGRFTRDYETSEIQGGLRGWQSTTGDSVDYYRFLLASSTVNDIYDEGDVGGKVYHGPMAMPVIRVVHEEGSNEDSVNGFYYNDDLHITASFAQLAALGLSREDLAHETFLKDRVTYDGKVFRVMKISILGQVNRRDIIVSIEATQVRNDELVNDAQFAAFVNFGTDVPLVDTSIGNVQPLDPSTVAPYGGGVFGNTVFGG